MSHMPVSIPETYLTNNYLFQTTNYVDGFHIDLKIRCLSPLHIVWTWHPMVICYALLAHLQYGTAQPNATKLGRDGSW